MLQYRNEILGALPPEELELVHPALQRVKFVLQQIVHEAGNSLDDVIFMESGLISLVADTGDSGMVEVGMTGNDGVVGATVLLNPNAVSVHRAVVQIPGTGHRMRAPAFRDAIARLPVLRDLCSRYLEVVMAQTAQAAGCNARHELPQRLARWLLQARDRTDSDELPMTQEFLSYMLGVRRAGVSVVANGLQNAGLIRQSRGRLAIINRAGLEADACGCYRLIEAIRLRIMRGK